jgi:hypothetical protein
MPEMDVFDVTRIARKAARDQTLPVEVIGVAPGRNGDYAEILVYVDGCPSDPCLVEMGVFRNRSEAELRQTIGDKLRSHIREHSSIA